MPLLTLLILAVVQGITEFLPVSSSGHLVLVHAFLDTAETDPFDALKMDIGVHIGTLAAVLLYFRTDLWAMFCGLFQKKEKEGRTLMLHLIIASVPVIIAGFILDALEPGWMRLLEVMAWMTILFGIVLWWADRTPEASRTVSRLKLKEAFLIGLAQMLALVPGTSRSGITMSAGRFLGLSRTEAAHFSLLLAIVAISGAGTLLGYDLYKEGNTDLGGQIFIAAILSFLTAYAAIAVMMKWLAKATFLPFAIYRVILGTLLLALLYSGVITG